MENENVSMNDIMNAIDETMKKIYVGDIVNGEIISVLKNEVLVNIGYMTDGVIKKNEICSDDEDINDILKVGDKINVYVLKMNDGDGNIVLSKKKADEIKKWEELNIGFKNKKIFSVKVEEVVKGGVITNLDGIRGFIPGSHIGLNFERDLSKFVGEVFKVKIIEFDRKKNKVVLSRKEVMLDEVELKKEEFWKKIKKGERRSGVVRRLTNFGAFIDLGGIDGLIHNVDLSWKRVNHPSEVVKIGDRVDVYVLDFDKEKGRISLGLKDVKENPWMDISSKYKINDTIEGKVVKLLDFGAFVEIEDGVEGLVHVSEITNENISKPSQVLKIGDSVKVKILDLNEENKKISLTIKDAEDKNSEIIEKYNDEDEGNFAFAELLKNIKF